MERTAHEHSYEWQFSRGWYRVLRGFFGLVFHTLWPLHIVGLQNVPRDGAGIVVCNHLSYVDPFVIGYSANRLVSFIAKKELFGVPVLGFLLRQVGAFPVDRSRRDAASMRTALLVLKQGELLGIFPEGTRSSSGELQEMRAGAARIAARTQTRIIPAAVRNTDRALGRGRFIKPARIAVAFGEPFELAELYGHNDRGEAMDRAVDMIRQRIEALQAELGR